MIDETREFVTMSTVKPADKLPKREFVTVSVVKPADEVPPDLTTAPVAVIKSRCKRRPN